MKKRTKEILLEIIDRNDITISSLAENFSVSQRTIRNDLNDINDFLKENNISLLSLCSNGKIEKKDDIKDAYELISDRDFYTYKLSKEERKIMIAIILIESSEYITLSKIADTLYVSRATIINDLGRVKEYLKSGNLTVISHANKGLRLDGLESDKRSFLLNIILSDQDNKNLISSINSENLLLKSDMDKIHRIINEQEHAHEKYLTDSSYLKLKSYLTIAILRLKKGELIEKQNITCKTKLLMSQDIFKYISQYCNIMTTVDEEMFLSRVLNGLRYLKKDNENESMVKIQLLTRQFIEGVSHELKMNLNDDYDFYQNLSNHLESIFRAKNNNLQPNEFIDAVVIKNPNVIMAARKHIDIIEKYAQRKICDIELAYITIHICAAIERKKNQEIAFHVILVCNGGIGTSQLLLAKLKTHYNFQIVDIVSSHDEKNINNRNADLVISTVPLENIKSDYVIVSPLFTDEDYIRLGSKIDEIRNARNIPPRIEKKEVTAKGLLNKLKSVFMEFEDKIPVELTEKVTDAILDYFDDGSHEELDYTKPYLHHLLPSSNIKLDVECDNWRDAIKISAKKLLDDGYIEERYIDSMIANIEENGPYVVISEGFAMPHEGIDSGTKKVGMNLIRLKNPIMFGDGEEGEEEVKFVCCLSAIDHNTHLKAFFNLVNMLGQDKFKEAMENAKTEYELSEIIRRYEYSI
ncbi:BglG family transcription antiterminator [Terrisporobacter glycolicus]|uniref:BglG family transcription antiterminator n=1 Tax=Terrisporobacter glycolicus TaxID=36841 RepID=UPI000A7BD620